MAKTNKSENDVPVTASVRGQQAIQTAQDAKDKKRGAAKPKVDKAVQTGARKLPTMPLAAQHLQTQDWRPTSTPALTSRPRSTKVATSLRGKVALITGGDSGIGRALAVLFTREGADVCIAYLNDHEDARETARCVEAEGQRWMLIRRDVKQPAFARKTVKQTMEQLGQLDILVNNAAFQAHADTLEDLVEARFEETFRTNIFGYFYMAKAALPDLKEGSCIINTGSVTGLQGSPKLLDYSATKGAIHAFTKSLASNLIDKDIRVNAVAPGPVWTPLNPADKSPEDIQEYGQTTTMKRPAQPEEISPAYVFLAAPACSAYITGIVLPATGRVGP